MRTALEILAEMISLGPMLPGSIIQTTQKKRNKAGEVVVYPSSALYTYTDPETRKQRKKRVNRKLFETVREMTVNYRRFEELRHEFEAALVRENLPGSSKKN